MLNNHKRDFDKAATRSDAATACTTITLQTVVEVLEKLRKPDGSFIRFDDEKQIFVCSDCGEEIPSTPPTPVSRTAEEIQQLANDLWDKWAIGNDNGFYWFTKSLFTLAIQDILPTIGTQPEEREAVEFFTMQQFPTQEPGETFSKTVLIYNKEDHSFCDLGFYDFETSEWAILGDMSMKLICWCYIPDASTFIKDKELKEELHRGYR